MASTGEVQDSNTKTAVDNEWAPWLKSGICQLFKEQSLTDIKLTVGCKEFPCHKIVLAAASPVFKAMFTCDMAEKKQDKVQLKEFTNSSIMGSVLDYIYTGKIVLNKDTVEQTLAMGDYLQMPQLTNICEQYMIDFLNGDNCIEMYFFARSHGCFDLAYNARNCICRNFRLLSQSKEFISLPKDKVIEILQFDELEIQNETLVFETCLAWLKHHTKIRKACVRQLIKCVRFAHIDAGYFHDMVARDALLKKTDEMKTFFETVLYYYSVPRRHGEIDLNYVPRIYGKPRTYEYGIVLLNNTCSIHNGPCLLLTKTGNESSRPWHIDCVPERLSIPRHLKRERHVPSKSCTVMCATFEIQQYYNC